MSVRLFHKHTRIVLPARGQGGQIVWHALHRRSVAWQDILGPALLLLGLRHEREADGFTFAGGSLRWSPRAFGTTLRLQLPRCSAKKAALLASGLLKAARYARG
jgi:hypothetical protein